MSNNMPVTLTPLSDSARPVLEQLFAYYVYELSRYTQVSVNAGGQIPFNSAQLDPYWQREDHQGYFIRVADELAGFVLLRRYPPQPDYYDIDQFFVLTKFSGSGVGKKALNLTLQRHPGQWQIRVLENNQGALTFWKKALRACIGESYQQSLDMDIDLQMHFLRFCITNNEAGFGRTNWPERV